jgi:hypothetical protein
VLGLSACRLKGSCIFLSNARYCVHIYVCNAVHGSDEPLCPGLEQEALIES